MTHGNISAGSYQRAVCSAAYVIREDLVKQIRCVIKSGHEVRRSKGLSEPHSPAKRNAAVGAAPSEDHTVYQSEKMLRFTREKELGRSKIQGGRTSALALYLLVTALPVRNLQWPRANGMVSDESNTVWQKHRCSNRYTGVIKSGFHRYARWHAFA